jgi:ferritin-like metal-binding protein YciE
MPTNQPVRRLFILNAGIKSNVAAVPEIASHTGESSCRGSSNIEDALLGFPPAHKYPPRKKRIMALREVLIDELHDMYSAENQLVKALPNLAKGAKNPELKSLFTSHLEETKGQVLRLKQVFELLGEKPTGEHCNGMEGIIEEGADSLEKDEEGPSLDSGIVGAALRTEHYEIAGYTATIAMAKTLGLKDVATLLTANLNEELMAAKKILATAQPILKESAKQPEQPKKPKTAKEKYSAQKSREDEKKAAPSLKTSVSKK